LKARSINEIVIVRALVSQDGRPSRVSLLRRSKAGPQLDDVVVAAVNQWTFSPAKKKGEAVSCWLNFGVQIGRAD
jgi:TonB family protein